MACRHGSCVSKGQSALLTSSLVVLMIAKGQTGHAQVRVLSTYPTQRHLTLEKGRVVLARRWLLSVTVLRRRSCSCCVRRRIVAKIVEIVAHQIRVIGVHKHVRRRGRSSMMRRCLLARRKGPQAKRLCAPAKEVIGPCRLTMEPLV